MVYSPMHEFVENRVWFEVKGKSCKSKRLNKMRSSTNCIFSTFSEENCGKLN